MQHYKFDDRNIHWMKLEGFDNFSYSIFHVSDEEKIVDVLFKFEANSQIVLHRHRTPNYTLVIEGEHHLFRADGSLKEVREAGSFTISPASEEPHRECGGDDGAVIFFSMRESHGVMYELLDDDGDLIAELKIEDFKALYQLGLAEQEMKKCG